MLRRLLPFNVRKQLATSLILSKLDHANIVSNGIPKYQINRLQKVQNAAAGFVHNRRANINDVIKLKWLPVKEIIDYAIAVLTFKALHDSNSPASIKVQLKEDRRPLRNQISNDGPTIECIDHVKTFCGKPLLFYCL